MTLPSRRAFLKTLGTAALALPFSRVLGGAVARAAGEDPPLRFLSIMNPHGTWAEFWRPRGGETDFSLTFEDSILAPLAPFRDKIVVLDGLDYRVAYEKGETGHRGSYCSFLTGTGSVPRDDSLYPTNMSIDQYLAGKLGGETKLPSLELSLIVPGGQFVSSTIAYGPGGVRIPSVIDPTVAFARLFGDLAGSQDEEARLRRTLLERKSVLDYVKGDLGRLQSRMAGSEREVLDAHLTSLRDIERRLLAPPPSSCAKPVAPVFLDPKKGENLPALSRLQLDLIAQAFSCDLTRFATLNYLSGGSGMPMPWLGPELDLQLHDGVAHRVGKDNPTANRNLASIHRWYAGEVAYLLGKLAAIPEGNGTVLDHTLILWGNELAQPAYHSCYNLPFVLMGGAKGAIRMGRYLRFGRCAEWPGTCPPDYYPTDQTAHNHLLVSILRAFGLADDFYGDPDYVGPLAGL
jgi:hypothetical protein